MKAFSDNLEIQILGLRLTISIQEIIGTIVLSLNRRNEEQLQVFERRILRKIFGPICDNVKWRIRYNRELYIYRPRYN